MRRMTLVEALQPDSPYVFYSDDHGFCINTADVMDILMMDKESGYHWIPCSGDMQKDDVIYRQAAIDAEKELCLHYTPTKSVKHPHIDFVVEELERLPSVRLERKKGRWSKPFNMGTYNYQCSECEKLSRAMYDFCPNCGADMRGESDE